jgi:hypothetical protein
MHVIGPVLVLAKRATVASLVAATTSLGCSATTVPAMLCGEITMVPMYSVAYGNK